MLSVVHTSIEVIDLVGTQIAQEEDTCLVYVLWLRLLKDDKTMGGFFANDPSDALELWINHKWPTCSSRDDGAIVYAKGISWKPLLCPLCL